jgi:hypothetical protein
MMVAVKFRLKLFLVKDDAGPVPGPGALVPRCLPAVQQKESHVHRGRGPPDFPQLGGDQFDLMKSGGAKFDLSGELASISSSRSIRAAKPSS